MLPQLMNSMITIMLAKFTLNDIPHYLFSGTAHRPIRIVEPGPLRAVNFTFTVKRTTINTKTLDGLEAAWHRIETDTSYKMQNALGILKEVMGYYYEQPAVVAYKGRDLVGVAVYEVGRDKDLQIDYTCIKELASFTHEPGVGRILVGEVIRIAKENACDEVTVSHGAGAKEFYEKLGFKLYKGAGGETGTLMVYKLKSADNPGTPPITS